MSSACPSNTASQILVDDRDPRINYSPGWSLAGTGKECDSTTHDSNFITYVTASFPFEGTGIQVYGTVPPTEFTPSAAFQVDELPSTPFSYNGDEAVHYQMMFYSTTSLSFGNHTLTMTVTSNSSTRLYLDYLVYDPLSYTTTAAMSNAASTAPSTSIAATESVVPSTSVTTIGSQPHFPAGAVAGGIAGATLTGLTLGVFLMRLLFHKSRRIQDFFRTQAKPDGGDRLIIERYSTSASLITPFTTDSNTTLATIDPIYNGSTTSSPRNEPREHDIVPFPIENPVEQNFLRTRELGTGMRYSDPPLYVE